MGNSLKIFISYAHLDATEIADRLYKRLEESGHKPWMDVYDPVTGVWEFSIEDVIDEIDVMLTLLSHAISDPARIVHGERISAVEKRKRIIPVLVHKDARVPLSIKHYQRYDFSDASKFSNSFERLLQDIESEGKDYRYLDEPQNTESGITDVATVQESESPNSEEKNDTAEDIHVGIASNELHQLTRNFDWILSFAEWSGYPDLYVDHVEFQIDAARQGFIDNFISFHNSEGIAGVHVLGRSGVGKTRLVFEAIRNHSLQSTTLYVLEPSSTLPNLIRQITDSNLSQLTLVIDNCTYDSAREFWQLITAQTRKIRLVTIESRFGHQEQNSSLPGQLIEPLGVEQIGRIVDQVYKKNGIADFNDDKASYSYDFVGGNLKLLIAFVEAYQHNPEIEGIGELTRLDELSHMLSKFIPAEYVSLRTLQGLALADGIGVSGNSQWELQEIANFLNINTSEFRLSTSLLLQRGTLTDKDWQIYGNHIRFVVPKLLAIKLAMDVWEALSDQILEKFLLTDAEGKNHRLRDSILRRLGDLGNQKLARPIVQRLLNDSFPDFSHFEDKSRLYALLGDADPVSVTRHLERVIRDVTFEQLRAFRNGRRDLIPLLARLLRLKETFKGAASILARFAAAENENYGNNAAGIWEQVFFIRLGPNPATPSERYDLIEKLLNSETAELRLVAVKAIESTFSNYEHGQVIQGPGGYLTPQAWFPETWAEFWDVRRNILPLLRHAMNDTDNEVSTTARNCLLKSARFQFPVLADEMLELLSELPRTDYYRLEGWKHIQEIFKYNSEHLSEEHRNQLHQLESELIADSYHDQLLIYVVDVDIHSRIDGKDYQAFRQMILDKIHLLAQRAIEDEILLDSELSWLTKCSVEYPSQLWPFIFALAALDDQHIWYSRILKQVQSNGNWELITAYLNGRMQKNDTDWVNNTRQVLALSGQLPAQAVLENISQTDSSDEGVSLALSILETNQGYLYKLRNPFHWYSTVSVDALRQILDCVLREQDARNLELGIDILHTRLHQHPEDAEALSTYAFTFLTSTPYKQSYSYEWENVARAYVSSYPVEVAGFVLTALKSSSAYFDHDDEIWKLLAEALRAAPSEVWKKIKERISLDRNETPYIYPAYLQPLHIDKFVDVNTLIEWAQLRLPHGAVELAELTSVDDDILAPLARAIIQNFSDNDEALRTLLGKFVDLGFHNLDLTKSLLESKKARAEKWLLDEDKSVRAWAQRAVDYLQDRIAEET